MSVATACTATRHASGHIVRITCTWSFPLADLGSLQVYRSTPSGGLQALRSSRGLYIVSSGGATYPEVRPIQVGTGTGIAGTLAGGTRDYTVQVIDLEPPQGALPTYYFVATQGATVVTSSTSTPAQPTRGADFLYDCGTTDARGAAVTVSEFGELTSEARDEVLPIIGRRSPVVVRDLRTNPSGRLTLSTETDAQARVMRAVLYGGNPLCLSPLYANYGIDAPIYFTAGNVTEQRVTKLGREATRMWQLDIQVTDPPPIYVGDLTATTFTDLGATYGTYAAVSLATTVTPFGLGMSGSTSYDPSGFGT